MTEPHELRCYEYVNHPYEVVRRAIVADPLRICGRATKGAAARADALASTLRVELGSLEVGTDVVIEVAGVDEVHTPRGAPRTTLRLRWKAARAAAIFPSMEAELSVYPLSRSETQLDLHGVYRPPFGVVGDAIDALVGHRVALASVHRFLADVAALLRSELARG
jgi:hypothetical protein